MGRLAGDPPAERAVHPTAEVDVMTKRVVVSVLAMLLVALLAPTYVGAGRGARADGASVAVAGQGTININTATVKELMTLEGIGEKVAQKIVEYREANGLFKSPQDLRKVKGVGARLLQKNRERIVVK